MGWLPQQRLMGYCYGLSLYEMIRWEVLSVRRMLEAGAGASTAGETWSVRTRRNVWKFSCRFRLKTRML